MFRPAAMRARMKIWRAHGFTTAPFQPDTKTLFSKAAARYHGKCTTAPEQVDALWKGKFAECNGGIKCAPGFVIVDIDPRNGGRESAIALGLLDTDGMPIGGAYCERTGGNGWRIVYTLPDGLGHGLKHDLLAPGVELFFESGQTVIAVAPSCVQGRPYLTLSDTLAFTPAPACIVDYAKQLQAEQTPKPAAIVPPKHALNTPQSIKSRYADATLLKLCDELRNTVKGARFNTLRRVSCVMGSVCAACDTGTTTTTDTTEAARQLEAACSSWTDPAKVKATIASGLAKGVTNPADIDWKHDAPETFRQAGQVVLDWLNVQTWNGVQESNYGRVSRATTQTIAIAMADYGLSHGLFGAFVISVRTLMQLTGCCWQTLRKSLDALRADGTLVIVGRDEFQFIKAAGTDAAAGDKRLQARCYQFNLAEIGRQMANSRRSSSTVIVHCGKGNSNASVMSLTNAPVTVLLLRDDTFSKLALGRSAAAVLSKLLANPAGLNDVTLAELTGLHVDTVGRAVGRLLLRGLVDCANDGNNKSYKSWAVDADAIQAALASVVREFELDARRKTRESIVKAERTAHGAYVQARRAGIEEADAQRLYMHVYNEIRHPGETPAPPLPTPGDYVNVWEQYAAAAQAKRNAAHVPTPTAEQISKAKAAANVNRYGAKHETLKRARELDGLENQAISAF